MSFEFLKEAFINPNATSFSTVQIEFNTLGIMKRPMMRMRRRNCSMMRTIVSVSTLVIIKRVVIQCYCVYCAMAIVSTLVIVKRIVIQCYSIRR